MCGIFARLTLREIPEEPVTPVRHRGPDAFGSTDMEIAGHRVHLAHWRLSVIDPQPSSNQPLSRQQNGAVIVFNGEIYNYRELRAEIGGDFQTASDTEVLLAAYEKWGTSCLNRLRGMFAFVIADPKNHRIFAARDRYGIKPLYFRALEGRIEIASEIKQLIAGSAHANLPRLREFLLYGSQDHTADTLFRDVGQLRGGEFLEVNLLDGIRARVGTWYHFPRERTFSGNIAEATDAYREKFFETVDLHLRSDVPLGFCLSGGMDSSAIVGSAAALLKNTEHARVAINCRYALPGFDENRYAKEVADFSGASLRVVSPDPQDLVAEIEKITYFQDEPVQNASLISGFSVFQEAARAGLKVMLDGQGGDEQLASYPQFFGPFLLGLLLRGRVSQMMEEAAHFAADHNWTWKNTANSLFLWYGPRRAFQILKSLKGKRGAHTWADRRFLFAEGVPSPPWKMVEDSSPTTRAMSLLMLRQLSLPMLLHWEDRNSMAHSIESRVPFMDHELIEFTLSLPDEFKICKGVTKRVLKDAMSGIIPPSVIARRDKMGFSTPEELWLRKHASGSLKNFVREIPEILPGIVDSSCFLAMWNGFVEGTGTYSPVIWRILATAIWAKKFAVRF